MKSKILGSILMLGATLASSASAAVDDRILHTGASMVVGSGMMLATNDRLTSYTMCAAVGIAKELYDEIDYGGASAKDLAYDALGCVIGVEATVVIFGVNVQPSVNHKEVGLNLNYEF